MKELSYKASGANKMKIAFAKRKQTIARVLGVFLLALLTISCVSADKSATALVLATAPVFMVGGKFKELKGEELDNFIKEASAEELAEYYNQKNAASRAELEAAIANKASKEDIENLQKQLKEDMAEQMKSLNAALKQYGLAIEKLNKNNADRGIMSNAQSIKETLGTAENMAKLKALQSSNLSEVQSSGVSFEIKAAANMLESTNISGGNVPVEQRIPGFNIIPTRRVRLLDLFAKGTATSNIISWVYQANRDGSAGGTTEGSAKNKIDFDLVVASQSVVKRTAYIKVSTEMLQDIDFIESEIRNELMRMLMLDVENTAYSGDGTAPALNGVRTVATAFSAGDFALAVDNPNEADVLVVAMNQIALANQEAPNAILMNPTDIAKLKLYKVSATDKRYIDRLLYIGDTLTLDAVPMIGTTLVTAGTYMVGNFNLATLYSKESVTINMGLDSDDWTKNLRTIIAEWRGALVVKNNNRTAFVKGTFSTDITALTKA